MLTDLLKSSSNNCHHAYHHRSTQTHARTKSNTLKRSSRSHSYSYTNVGRVVVSPKTVKSLRSSRQASMFRSAVYPEPLTTKTLQVAEPFVLFRCESRHSVVHDAHVQWNCDLTVSFNGYTA